MLPVEQRLRPDHVLLQILVSETMGAEEPIPLCNWPELTAGAKAGVLSKIRRGCKAGNGGLGYIENKSDIFLPHSFIQHVLDF